MSVMKLDEIDKKIIRMLQVDARTSFKEIAIQCNRSVDIIKNRYNKMKKMELSLGVLLLLTLKR